VLSNRTRSQIREIRFDDDLQPPQHYTQNLPIIPRSLYRSQDQKESPMDTVRERYSPDYKRLNEGGTKIELDMHLSKSAAKE
jgi:hypothetical protein